MKNFSDYANEAFDFATPYVENANHLGHGIFKKCTKKAKKIRRKMWLKKANDVLSTATLAVLLMTIVVGIINIITDIKEIREKFNKLPKAPKKMTPKAKKPPKPKHSKYIQL
ncbi:MAG: hypothetical protein RSB38_06690 [Oscillospiraceae bacterium]